MAPLPSRCTHYNAATDEACDDWADDGDRCDTHPRRPQRNTHTDRLDPED